MQPREVDAAAVPFHPLRTDHFVLAVNGALHDHNRAERANQGQR